MRQQWQLWKSSLSAEQCESLIRICSQYPVSEGTTFGGNSSSVRRSQVRWVDDDKIRNLMMGYANQANRNAFGFDISNLWEIQFTEYRGEDDGFYTWHHDIDWKSDRAFDRKLSIVIQLSDPSEYEGGNFAFDETPTPTGFREQGSVLVFPSYLRHMVQSVTEGNRYSLVGWVEGPKWR